MEVSLTVTGKGTGLDGNPADFKTVTEHNSKAKHTFNMWMGQTTCEPMMTAARQRMRGGRQTIA